MNLQELKKKLKNYSREHIEFNEPHFTERLILREGGGENVIKNLLEPEKLVYFYTEKRKHGEVAYNLFFKISNTRTLKLPVIFDRFKKKSLFVITYIMRYRPWQSLVRKNEKS